MRRIANPELDRIILDHLVTLYNLKTKREGVHLSTLVYCLTRSFFNQLAPAEPTDEEVMLFALGLGLQDVLTPKQATVPIYEKDGITFSPDMVFTVGDTLPTSAVIYQYVELKTTRSSLKKNLESLPETWVEYIMGGCYIRNVTTYELCGLYMMGSYAPPFPKIYSETLIFEEAELLSNWQRLVERRGVYVDAIEANQPPTPFFYCKEWECKNCRYRLQCEALTMLAKREQSEKDIKELW